jgi:uncharacterized CHY-type Zn-finger protein
MPALWSDEPARCHLLQPVRRKIVSSSNWQIEQSCPQCGAPITLDETDHILDCPFCRTRLYLAPNVHFSYYLPPSPKMESRGELLYIPYWRFRGSSFTAVLSDLGHRFLDRNIVALKTPGLRPSIGLRPQTLKLHFVTADTKGRFIKPDRSLEQALPQLTHNRQERFHNNFIGEVINLIYSPLLLYGNKLYDGILGKHLLTTEADFIEKLLSQTDAPKTGIKFIPTLCPYCGWEMEGEKGSLVMICKNCNSAWTLQGQTFGQIKAVTIVAPGTDENTVYLPFWQMKLKFEGIDLSSYADLIRIANLPKAVTSDIEDSPLHFWSPAFKINPALYLRLCRQMTVLRPYEDEAAALPRNNYYQATLPLEEAKEGVFVNLAQMIRNKKRHYPKLKGLSISIEKYRLEYHPFLRKGRELINQKSGLAISSTALAFGSKL